MESLGLGEDHIPFRSLVELDRNPGHNPAQRLECQGNHVDRLGLGNVVDFGTDLVGGDHGIQTAVVAGMEAVVRGREVDSEKVEEVVGFE